MSIIESPVEVDPLELIPTLPEKPETRRGILLRAAELIEKHGWRKDSLGSPSEGFCLLGAVAYAAGIRTNCLWPNNGFANVNGVSSTMEIVDPGLGMDTKRVTNWNDAMDGHWGHVGALAALRRLANGATWEDAVK